MKAAIVHAFGQLPEYGEMEAPRAEAGEILVSTRAAALSQLVRAQAAGKHYSSGKTLPLVPGADGVGVLADGRRVVFAFSRPPVGSMAQQVAIKPEYCAPIPDSVDDITAAAIVNPGMSSLAALEQRAHFQAGESVLINGAAGASGRLAIQIAKALGAGRVLATARNPAVESELRALGADDFICLQQSPEALTAAFHRALQEPGVDVVLDYLWGVPAECIINAAAGLVAGAAQPRIRFVNIGSLAGLAQPIAAGALRSSGLELMGSGLGSVANDVLVQCMGRVLQLVEPAGLRIATLALPAEEVRSAWQQQCAERIVLTF